MDGITLSSSCSNSLAYFGTTMTSDRTDHTHIQAGDGDLLAAASLGDGSAFRQLLERYVSRVFANCYRVLGETSAAEDATQESFARLWKVIASPEGAAAPDRDAGGWLMRVSRNLCIDRLRRNKGWTTDESILAQQPDPAPNAEAQQQSKDVGSRVQDAIKSLPDRQRTALALVHFDAVPQTEAAAAMGISVDALESLLARARRALKQALADEKDNLL